jgi:hypothetical protein
VGFGAVRGRACAAIGEAVEHWTTLKNGNMVPASSALSLQQAQSRMRQCRPTP